jgi:protein-disulfide isomerase/uncharacterized membrane protein
MNFSAYSPQRAKVLSQSFLFTSAAAWIVALVSLWHRQGVVANGLVAPSFCKMGEQFDCDAVALSSYSSVAGFPVAALGMIFAALALTLGFWLYSSSQDSEKIKLPASWAVWVTGLALVPTLALAAVSVIALKTICLLCFVTYVLHTVLFVLALLLYRQSRGPLAVWTQLSEVPKPFWVANGVLVAVHFLAPAMVTAAVDENRGIAQLEKALVQEHFQSPAREFRISNAPTKGPENAPVTIVEYSDFQCPFCARSAATMSAILKAYEGRVRYIYRNYPLDASCNPNGGRHALACLASKLGHCLFEAKGSIPFFAYKESVFENQSSMTRESLFSTAQAFGIGKDALEACVAKAETHQSIVNQINEGSANGVEGTPAIFVNGRSVRTAFNPRVLTQILDQYLKP